MGKNKLARFAELATFQHVLQPSKDEVLNGFALAGKWKSDFFKNDRPLVVELGCGRGEYSVALGQRDPSKNYLGIDIKGARIWEGAKKALVDDMNHVGFLRTRIEWVKHCFAPGEIDEIWITFPDPQIKYQRAKHRMIGPAFLEVYRSLLAPEGCIHLKSDSEFLHGYLHGIIEWWGLEVVETYNDIYGQIVDKPDHVVFACQTFYEKMWLKQGKTITYLQFKFPSSGRPG